MSWKDIIKKKSILAKEWTPPSGRLSNDFKIPHTFNEEQRKIATLLNEEIFKPSDFIESGRGSKVYTDPQDPDYRGGPGKHNYPKGLLFIMSFDGGDLYDALRGDIYWFDGGKTESAISDLLKKHGLMFELQDNVTAWVMED